MGKDPPRVYPGYVPGSDRWPVDGPAMVRCGMFHARVRPNMGEIQGSSDTRTDGVAASTKA